MKKFLMLLAILAVTVCLKEGITFQIGTSCMTFKKSLGSSGGAYVLAFETYEGKKVIIPVENIKTIEED